MTGDQAAAAAEQLQAELNRLGIQAHVRPWQHRDHGWAVVLDLDPAVALGLVVRLRTQLGRAEDHRRALERPYQAMPDPSHTRRAGDVP